MEIYIHRDGQQSGPHSLDEIKAQLGSGELHQDDLAWYDGAADWTSLSLVPGIAGSALRLSSRQEPAATGSFRAEEPKPASRSRTRTLIILWGLAAGLFSLICLLTTLFMVAASSQKGLPW